MRRVALVFCLLGLAAAGVLAAGLLAGPGAALVGLSDTTGTTETTGTTAPATTEQPPTTAPTTTPEQSPSPATTTTQQPLPSPKPKPKPAPRPKPKPQPAPKPEPKPAPRIVRLPGSVKVGGIHVGGLTPKAAVAVVRTAFVAPLVIRVGVHRFPVAPRRIGAVAYVKAAVARAVHALPGTAVPLHVVVHVSAVRSYLDSLGRRFRRDPVDSVLLLRKLVPFVTEGAPGQRLDELSGERAIVAALAANRRTPILLRLVPVPQKVSRASFGPVVVIRRESRRLFFYKGMRFLRAFGVAVGQATYPTPLGRFAVVVKWRNPWWYPPASPWAQGLKPVPPGPGNPLGTRWMGLSAPGVGIHGTPDDASIGYSLSHGCIRMHIPDAEWLFQHVEVGTTVFIVPA